MKRKVWWGLGILLALCVVYYILGSGANASPADPLAEKVAQVEAASQQAEVGPYVYYITGAVEEPGLYESKEALTVGKLVQLAGGPLPYAQLQAVNMAATAESGTQVHIPFDFHGDMAELLRKKKININTADEKTLQSIRGIGPETAKRIIAYRTEHGPFTQIQDLQKVKGIGPGIFKKCQDAITI